MVLPSNNSQHQTSPGGPAPILFWAIVLLCVLAQHFPLLECFYLEDDFDHLLASANGTEFTGRPGWFNYIPLPGFVFWLALKTGLTESAVILRSINGLLLLANGIAVFTLVRKVGGSRFWAGLATLLLIMHPMGIGIRLRLNCLHYAMANLMIFTAIIGHINRLQTKQMLWQLTTLLSVAACLFSSVHGVLVVPALAVCHFILHPTVKTWTGKLKALWQPDYIFMALLSAVWAGIFLTRPMGFDAIPDATPGTRLIAFFNLHYASLFYHPSLWDAIIAPLLIPRWHGIPVAGIALMAAGILALLWTAKCSYKKFPLLTAAVLLLILGACFPSKVRYMPRYSYLALPWAAIVLAGFISMAKERFSKPVGQGAVLLFSGLLLLSSIPWHLRYNQNVIQATQVTRQLHDLLEPMEEPLCAHISGMPLWIARDYNWPRCTANINEIEELIALMDKDIAQVTIGFKQSDTEDHSWESVLGDPSLEAACEQFEWKESKFVPIANP